MNGIKIIDGRLLITPEGIDDLAKMKRNIIETTSGELGVFAVNLAQNGTIEGLESVYLNSDDIEIQVATLTEKQKSILSKLQGVTHIGGDNITSIQEHQEYPNALRYISLKVGDTLYVVKEVDDGSVYLIGINGSIWILRDKIFRQIDYQHTGKNITQIYIYHQNNRNFPQLNIVLKDIGYISIQNNHQTEFFHIDTLDFLEYQGIRITAFTYSKGRYNIKHSNKNLDSFDTEQELIDALELN